MSDAVLDRGFYVPSPMTDWYRERPFQFALVASLLIHAALIALVPGFRAVVIEPPKVLNVEIVRPEPVMRQPEPEQPPIPRVEMVQPLPRPEPRLEPVVVPKPEPRPEPRIEPKIEIKPEPRIEPRPEPQPVARVEPPPVPVAQPRIEPVTPTVQPPAPPVAAVTVQPAPVAAPVPPPAPPQPVALKKEPSMAPVEPRLLQIYGQSISKEIKRYQKYPPLAQRRGWEGTAGVLLQIAADGKVTSITLARSSGRSVLDEEALNMVRRASPLPQAPQNLRGHELTVTVPIVFKLQES